MHRLKKLLSLASFLIFNFSYGQLVNDCQNCQNNALNAFKGNMADVFGLNKTADINEAMTEYIYRGDFEKFVRSSGLKIGLNILKLGFLEFGSNTDEAWEKLHVLINNRTLVINNHFWEQMSYFNPNIKMAEEFRKTILGCPCYDQKKGETTSYEILASTNTEFNVRIRYTPPDTKTQFAVIDEVSYDGSMFDIDKNHKNEKVYAQGIPIKLKLKKNAKWAPSSFTVTFKAQQNPVAFIIPGKLAEGKIYYKFKAGLKAIPIRKTEAKFRNVGLENFRGEVNTSSDPKPYYQGNGLKYTFWLEPDGGSSRIHVLRTIEAEPGQDIANVRIDMTDIDNNDYRVLPYTGLEIVYKPKDQPAYSCGKLQKSQGTECLNHKAPIVEVHTWNRSNFTEYVISYDVVRYEDNIQDNYRDVVFNAVTNSYVFAKTNEMTNVVCRIAINSRLYEIGLEDFENNPMNAKDGIKDLFTVKVEPQQNITNYIITYHPEKVNVNNYLK